MSPHRVARLKAYWTEKGVIPRWQLLGVYALVILVGVIGFNIVGSAADKATSAANEAKAASAVNRKLAVTAKVQATKTRRLAVRIQRQRKALCKDQNGRHDATLAQLDKQLKLIVKKHPDEAAAIKESRAGNIALISALAPKRKCGKITTNP